MALRIDGLQLVAQQGSFAYAVTRSSRDGPFGSWTRAASLDTPYADIAYFADAFGDEVYLAADKAQDSTPRRLWYCDPTNVCKLATFEEADGTPIVEDMDGPSIRRLPSGSVIGVHNVDPNDALPPLIYATYAETPRLLGPWISMPIDAINAQGGGDDPALSLDELLLVFERDGRLWASERQSVEDPFDPARALTELGPSASIVQSSVDVGLLEQSPTSRRYERFFSQSENGSPPQIMRAICLR